MKLKLAILGMIIACCAGISVSADNVIRVFTHGESVGALPSKDGSLKGKHVNVLTCAMAKVGRKFTLNIASIPRSYMLEQEGKMDVWFPSLKDVDIDFVQYVAVGLGYSVTSWFTRESDNLDVTNAAFKLDAKVASFPESRNERWLASEGYNLVTGSDSAERLVLKLLTGEVDGILVPEIKSELSKNLIELMDSKLQKTHFSRRPFGFEFNADFHKSNHGLLEKFRVAAAACGAQLL